MIVTPDSPIPEQIRTILLRTFNPSLFKKLATEPANTSKQGKGSNTNYAENVIMKSWRIAGINFHPNGVNKSPDAILDGIEFEWKACKGPAHKFMFNDSIPQGGRYYCLYSRSNRKALIIAGDVLALSMNERLVKRIFRTIRQARKTGKDKKGLCFFYPRNNLIIQNFLLKVPANGYFDYDRGVIWTPQLYFL